MTFDRPNPDLTWFSIDLGGGRKFNVGDHIEGNYRGIGWYSGRITAVSELHGEFYYSVHYDDNVNFFGFKYNATGALP